MDLIDFLIDFTTLGGAVYLSMAFIAGLGKRRVSSAGEQPTEQELFDALADLGADVAAGLMSEQEAVEVVYGPIITDCVVPFRRPVRPAVAMPTDRELIELAKSTDYPGAKKWNYNRKLTQKTRAALLKVWGTLAA